MKSIKTSISPKLVALLAGATLLGLVSQGALALGTASGTIISNAATLGYSVGGVGQTAIVSAAATFAVDNKINLTVTGTGASILPNSTNQALYFTVSNIGNTSQSYTLAASINGAPTATMTLVGIYNDDSGTPGTYISGTNTVYVPGVVTVAAGASLKVFIVASQTAPTAINGQTSTWNLLATTDNAGTAVATAVVANTIAGVEAVFAEGVAGTAAGDGLNDGKQSNTAIYTVAVTVPTVVKTAALLCDPFNTLVNAKNIPGSMTQWTIVVTNPSLVPVVLTTITDLLTNTTLEPGQVAGLTIPAGAATCLAGPGTKGFKITTSAARNIGGVAAISTGYFTTGVADGDGVDSAAGTVTATFATILPVDAGHLTAGVLNASETVTLIFNSIVN